MRIDRIMGVVLSILVVSFIALKYYSNEEKKTNPFELIGDNGYMSENVVYEALARKNYHISAKFSEEKNGKLYNSLSVPKNNKIYIHIISEYSGDLPQNSVDCKYSLNIASS